MSPIKLPRLSIKWRDQPELFERYWDDAMSSIESTLNAILAIPEIEDALVAVAAATVAAQAAADNANDAADAVTSESSLVNSFIPAGSFVAPLISADSLGNVTIVNHTRQYGNPALNPNVPVTGNTIATTGIALDVIRVYYIDALREGGAVAYLYTVDPAPAPVQGSNIHSVGSVQIPAAGSQDGNYVKPPGFVDA